MPLYRALCGLLAAIALFAIASGPARAGEANARAAFARGDAVAGSGLVDERGAPFRFARFRGRALALSFVYTRCPDARFCPLVAGKFAYLQSRIDPAREHLVLLSLDPAYDTPAVLRAYAKRLGGNPSRWSFVTGDPATLARIARGFGITPQRRDAQLIHAETVAVIDGNGRVADIVNGASWDPRSLLADLGAVAGIGYNPLERALVHFTWSLETLCGARTSSEPIALHHAIELLLSVPAFIVFCLVLAVERFGPKRRRANRRFTEPAR